MPRLGYFNLLESTSVHSLEELSDELVDIVRRAIEHDYQLFGRVVYKYLQKIGHESIIVIVLVILLQLLLHYFLLLP